MSDKTRPTTLVLTLSVCLTILLNLGKVVLLSETGFWASTIQAWTMWGAFRYVPYISIHQRSFICFSAIFSYLYISVPYLLKKPEGVAGTRYRTALMSKSKKLPNTYSTVPYSLNPFFLAGVPLSPLLRVRWHTPFNPPLCGAGCDGHPESSLRHPQPHPPEESHFLLLWSSFQF